MYRKQQEEEEEKETKEVVVSSQQHQQHQQEEGQKNSGCGMEGTKKPEWKQREEKEWVRQKQQTTDVSTVVRDERIEWEEVVEVEEAEEEAEQEEAGQEGREEEEKRKEYARHVVMDTDLPTPDRYMRTPHRDIPTPPTQMRHPVDWSRRRGERGDGGGWKDEEMAREEEGAEAANVDERVSTDSHGGLTKFSLATAAISGTHATPDATLNSGRLLECLISMYEV